MEKCFELVKGRHSVGEYNFHVVLVVAYRRRVFERGIVMRLVRAYIEAKAQEMRIRIDAMEFGPDHMHIFASRCGRWSGYELKRQLKGFTGFMMRKNHKPLFRDMLWARSSGSAATSAGA